MGRVTDLTGALVDVEVSALRYWYRTVDREYPRSD